MIHHNTAISDREENEMMNMHDGDNVFESTPPSSPLTGGAAQRWYSEPSRRLHQYQLSSSRRLRITLISYSISLRGWSLSAWRPRLRERVRERAWRPRLRERVCERGRAAALEAGGITLPSSSIISPFLFQRSFQKLSCFISPGVNWSPLCEAEA